MQSFTFGSDEGMAALVKAMRSQTTDDPLGTGHRSSHQWVKPYELSLNSEDFAVVAEALRDLALAGEGDQQERAWSLLSGMAETLGIEFV